MKIEELEEWVKTDDGKKWLDEKKRPLVEKRDQLLDELQNLKNRLAGETEKSGALDGKINGYLEKLKKEFVKGCFDDWGKFKNTLVPDEELREFVAAKIGKIADADGGLIADIDDDGQFTYKTADGKSFEDYYSEWLGTEGAKSYIANPSTGGGARGSGFGNSCGDYSLNAVKRMTPEEVAKNLDNPAFRASLKS